MSNNGPKVLVTGADGFVGRHLSAYLQGGGWNVRRTSRRALAAEGYVKVDAIGPETVWEAALSGVEAVVHLAARVHHPNEERDYDVYRKVNVDGTLRLARSASAAGVRRFIFMSTVLVHGRTNDGRLPFCEEDALTPRGVYGQSKAEAEIGLKLLAQDSDMSVTVVRPPMIFGSGAKGNFALLVKAVEMGLPLPFASIFNNRAFVSVQNLASFVSWRLANPMKRFDVFLVADSEQVSTSEFIERLAKASGNRVRLFTAPESLLKFFFGILGRSEVRDSLFGSLELDISKAASCGWRPQFSLDEGLRLAISLPPSPPDHPELRYPSA